MSYKSFLPKFLWKCIIKQLSMADIKTMLIADKSFDSLIDDSMWKQYFIDERKCAIALVRCESKRMDNFWKYAYYNYIGCYDIDAMFTSIEFDNKINMRFNRDNHYYYKIFIKCGRYEMGASTRVIKFDYAICNVKIIGCAVYKSIISLNGDDNTEIIFTLLSIKNIIFEGLGITCYAKQCNNISELYISNCEFEGGYGLVVESISNIYITKCKFTCASLSVDDYELTDNESTINCIILDNMFENTEDVAYLVLGGNYSKSSVVNITNNTFKNTTYDEQLLIYNTFTCATIKMTANVISNIFRCILFVEKKDSLVILEDNTFIGMDSLFDDVQGDVKLSSNNTFINCEPGLTNFIDQT